MSQCPFALVMCLTLSSRICGGALTTSTAKRYASDAAGTISGEGHRESWDSFGCCANADL
jgi:hypothetical protein